MIIEIINVKGSADVWPTHRLKIQRRLTVAKCEMRLIVRGGTGQRHARLYRSRDIHVASYLPTCLVPHVHLQG